MKRKRGNSELHAYDVEVRGDVAVRVGFWAESFGSRFEILWWNSTAPAFRPCKESISDGSPTKRIQVMNLRKALSLGLRLAFVFLLGVMFTGKEARVAAQSFRGGIRGVVIDAHGLLVPGAKVVARNLGTSETREVA